jgi:hypothetical protein
MYCNTHKRPGDVDLRHAMCQSPDGCDNVANPRCREHADRDLCMRCFNTLYPEAELARELRFKERLVAEALQAALAPETAAKLVFDRRITGGTSACRPDVFLDMDTFTVISETDEFQRHKLYANEDERTQKLWKDTGERPMCVLRLNPDDYTDGSGKRHTSCFGIDRHGKREAVCEAQQDQGVEAAAGGAGGSIQGVLA